MTKRSTMQAMDDMKRCPRSRMDDDHYRSDHSCRCREDDLREAHDVMRNLAGALSDMVDDGATEEVRAADRLAHQTTAALWIAVCAEEAKDIPSQHVAMQFPAL